MTVGERIKKRREELHLSQSELAKKIGISRQAVSKAELHDSNITTDKVAKFAKALNCTSSYLMGWTGELYSESQIELNNEMFDAISEGKKWDWLDIDEQDIIASFRTLNDEAKRQLILMLAFLKDQENKKQ